MHGKPGLGLGPCAIGRWRCATVAALWLVLAAPTTSLPVAAHQHAFALSLLLAGTICTKHSPQPPATLHSWRPGGLLTPPLNRPSPPPAPTGRLADAQRRAPGGRAVRQAGAVGSSGCGQRKLGRRMCRRLGLRPGAPGTAGVPLTGTLRRRGARRRLVRRGSTQCDSRPPVWQRCRRPERLRVHGSP